MKQVRIRLDLSRHCIETAVRKRYNRLVGRALRNEAWAEELQAEIELLKSALEHLDFSDLRIGHPPLAGSSTDLVELEAAPEGRPRIRINGRPVE